MIGVGWGIVVGRMIPELENATPALSTRLTHAAVLTILERFLYEQDARHWLTLPQYQRILEVLITVRTSNYAVEQEIQQQARTMLSRLVALQEAQTIEEHPTGKLPPPGNQAVIEGSQGKALPMLIHYLSSGDEVLAGNTVQTLQQIGPTATAYLLGQLKQEPAEAVRLRILEILKTVHDPDALSAILRLVADQSLHVLQQVTNTLHSFGSESIPGLINLVLSDPNDTVAERAAQMLASMRQEIVVPVSQAISPIVPGRTRLLVQVLEQTRDSSVIPALISLVKPSQDEPLLAIAVIRALSQFPTQQVVAPLLEMLESPQPQIYEETIRALSSLSDVALDKASTPPDCQTD